MNRFRLYTLALTSSMLLVACSPAMAKHGGPSMVVVMETGTIRVHNDSSFAMQLRLDGANVGHVAAGSHLMLTSTPAGPHRLVAVYPGREDVPMSSFDLKVYPGQVANAVIRQAAGSVRVTNPNGFKVHVLLAGQSRGALGPGASMLLTDVPAGRQEVAVQSPNGSTMAGRIRVLPGRLAQWEPALFTGALTIRNSNHFPVRIFVDGRPAGKLAHGASRTVDGLVPGQHSIEVRNQHGLRVVHNAMVRASQTTSWAFAAPMGPHHKVTVVPAGPSYPHPPKAVAVAPKYGKKGGSKKGGWKHH